jgi:hypothetical protein
VYNQLKSWRGSYVLLPALLALHALVSLLVVLWGRRGFECGSGPGASAAVIVASVGALLGLARAGVCARTLFDRVVALCAAAVPAIWLWAVATQLDYDAVAGAMSATAFAEQDNALWFPGVTLGALGYTFGLASYVYVCFVALRSERKSRYERGFRWACGALAVVSFAGIVHWATGW